jgi:glycosyltransferase involved in cell wall biosynthesis
VRLVIVGPSGWDGTSGALPPSIPPGVELAGMVDDQRLSDLLAGALGFVYVPLLEGFGLPPLEAMRAGVPTIVSTTVPSVVEGSNGTDAPSLLVAPSDERALASTIERLVADEDMRAEYRDRGHAFTITRTWAATAADHLACWSSR